MRFLPALLLAGCVSVTTRATVTIGAGGQAEMTFTVDGADTLVVRNTGSVPVDVIEADVMWMQEVVLAPGHSRSIAMSGSKTLRIFNRADREAAVVVETRSAVQSK